MNVIRWVLVGTVGTCMTGCLFYDSHWGQGKAEQKHYAAHLQPASLDARQASDRSLPHRRARVRACVTRAYAAETLDWQPRFVELLRTASTVLEPALGLTLDSGGTTLWAPEHGEGGLATVISDLRSCEGAEADWVVALVQSTPKVVSDFHIAGRGQAYSPYLAIRAPNDPAELEALTKSLPDLDESERQKLYSERKRHKTVTVFLHELGHTLGAVHRIAKDTIMSRQYDASEHGYDDATLALLRDGLAIRLDHANLQTKVRKYLETNPGGFMEADRLELIEFLHQWDRFSEQTPKSTSVAMPGVAVVPSATPVTEVDFETMPKEDRQTFDEALKLEATSPRDAWEVAAPLFEAHPTVRAVQELRCRLAKARKFFAGVIEAHCARLSALEGASHQAPR